MDLSVGIQPLCLCAGASKLAPSQAGCVQIHRDRKPSTDGNRAGWNGRSPDLRFVERSISSLPTQVAGVTAPSDIVHGRAIHMRCVVQTACDDVAMRHEALQRGANCRPPRSSRADPAIAARWRLTARHRVVPGSWQGAEHPVRPVAPETAAETAQQRKPPLWPAAQVRCSDPGGASDSSISASAMLPPWDVTIRGLISTEVAAPVVSRSLTTCTA